MKNRVDAVFFDLDGTLLDSLADLANSANDALRSLGFSGHPIDAYRIFIGDGVRTLFERSLPQDAVTDDHLDACVDAMKAAYQRRWKEASTPYPGIPELLDELHGRNIPLTILSNKPDPFTQELVQTFFSQWPFALVCGAVPEYPLKPDPSSAKAMVAALALDPAHIWYLGDTSTDMKTAVAAGFHAVGVTWGFRDRSELIAHGAAHIIDHPNELLELLDSPGII